MITTEELNLEGKWWLPDRDNEIRIGNLTLNQLHKHGVLSIYGSFSGTREAAIILGELSEEKAKRLEQMTKHCFDASLKERVAAVYHEYADVADSLFFFKGEEEFSKKVKDTRNYLTHWSEDGEKKGRSWRRPGFLNKRPSITSTTFYNDATWNL